VEKTERSTCFSIGDPLTFQISGKHEISSFLRVREFQIFLHSPFPPLFPPFEENCKRALILYDPLISGSALREDILLEHSCRPVHEIIIEALRLHRVRWTRSFKKQKSPVQSRRDSLIRVTSTCSAEASPIEAEVEGLTLAATIKRLPRNPGQPGESAAFSLRSPSGSRHRDKQPRTCTTIVPWDSNLHQRRTR